LFLLLATLFSFTACEAIGSIKDLASVVSNVQDVVKDLEKFEKLTEGLENFKITLEYTSESGDKTIYTQKRCAEGSEFTENDYIQFTDFKKTYDLYPLEKFGSVSKYYSSDYSNFSGAIAVYLYFAQVYRLGGADKGGSEKINGRKATIYTYNKDGENVKLWIDDEYGITLKFERTTESENDEGEKEYRTEMMEVTEFKIGGVTLSDMVNLDEYEIPTESDWDPDDGGDSED
jgi:hypothetical protein